MQNQQTISERKRRQRDISRLIQNNYKVDLETEAPEYILIDFEGPTDTLYHGGIWKLRIHLPDNYPYKSPSIGFINKIFHPNVDFPFFKKLRFNMSGCDKSELDSHV